MSAERFLEVWAGVVHEVDQLLAVALDVEPPGGEPPPWLQLLSRYSVASMPEAARLAEFKRDGQTKGAVLREVQLALEGLARSATARLAPLRNTLSAQQANLVDEALQHLAAQALAQYRMKATEKKKRMFGAAKALAAQHQYSGSTKASGYVLSCAQCHAPRLGESLTCAFCGGDLEVMA
jgi:hypothetical protein